MAAPWISLVYCPPEIEYKLRHKHGLTPSDVDEAVLTGAAQHTHWSKAEGSNGDRRLYAEGTTFHGLRILVVLVPMHPYDPDDGAWLCVTAYPI